jgi:hypothetical protein
MEKVLTQEGLTPEIVMGIGKKMREALLHTLTPEERLAGLNPEELARLMAHIETFLHQQKEITEGETDRDAK